MFEVVVDGSLVVLQQRVGVPQTVTGLGLHRSVLQKPGQLQRSPEGRTQEEEEEKEEEKSKNVWGGCRRMIVICNFPPRGWSKGF